MAETLLCPVEPHEMDKPMLNGFEDMVRRVVLLESQRGWGKDLLLPVFLAGVHVGAQAQGRRSASESDATGKGQGDKQP